MGILFPILVIIAGILAASSVVIQKLPDSAEYINKIKPYEGFIGAGSLIMGAFTLFSFTRILASPFLIMAGTFTCIVSSLIMGFLLGYPVLQDLFLDDLGEASRKKSEDIYEKLTPYKVTSGLVGIGAGLTILLLNIF
jgi:hypothetical protein